MKRLINLPMLLAIGVISIVAAGMLGMIVVGFGILDWMLTSLTRKRKHCM